MTRLVQGSYVREIDWGTVGTGCDVFTGAPEGPRGCGRRRLRRTRDDERCADDDGGKAGGANHRIDPPGGFAARKVSTIGTRDLIRFPAVRPVDLSCSGRETKQSVWN